MAFTGTNSMVQVGVSMVLQDRFTQEAGKISGSFKGMMNEINDWNRGINMAIGYSFDAGRAMIGGMYDAYKYSAGVSKEILLAAKMSGATTQQQNEMFRLAQEINSRNPLTALDIASGEKFMAMAGNAPDQIKKMIEPAAQLAAIFGMNLGGKGGVADLMTNIMATFNIPGTQATDVVDKLGIATTSTNMSLNDLAAAFQYSGAEFRNAKLDMGTAAAAIGVLGDQGIQASSAGTALANMYRYLTLSITGQRKKGYEALKAIGIEPKSLLDAKGNLKDISTLVKTIGDHLGKDASTQKATSFFYNAVGVRGSRALSGLLQDYWTGRNKLETVIAKYNDPKNADWTNKAMQDYMKSPQGRIDALTSSFENLKVSAGAALADVFNPILKGITTISNVVNQITNTGFGGWIIRVGSMSVMIFTAIQGFRMIYMTTRMITTTFQQQNAQQTQQQAKLVGMNAVYTQMEAHLRTMVALQMQLTGLQMAPGTRMTLPMGGTLGKSKSGNVTVGVPTSISPNGRITPGGYANAISTATGAAAGAAAGAAGRAAAGATVGVGSRILGFLGGPWGIGLSIGIPIIVDLLGKWFNKDQEENDEAAKRQEDLMQMQNLIQQNMAGNITNAVREGVIQGNSQSPQRLTIDYNGTVNPGAMPSFNNDTDFNFTLVN